MEELSVLAYLKLKIIKFFKYKPSENTSYSSQSHAETMPPAKASVFAWFDILSGAPEESSNSRLTWREKIAEWGVIVLGAWLYFQPILGVGSDRHLPGNESNFFQLFDKLLEVSLKNGQGFPLWNPYFFTGMPYVGDAMSHAFNPFISVPVLLFGTLDGFKIAILINMLFGAMGMWWLARQMEISRPIRIWAALLYVFCGVAAAKFIQGHYLLTIGFGWLVFSLAAFLNAIKSGKPAAIAVSALSLAFLFFSGNGYYAYFMLWVILFAVVFFLPDLKISPFQFNIPRCRWVAVLGIGTLALGLVAIQLLPMAEMFPYIGKQVINSVQSHTPAQVWRDFTVREIFRADTKAIQVSLRPEEYYAYLGIIPLIGAGFSLIVLPFSQKKRWILFYAALILFTLAWANLQAMPWRDFLDSLPVISGFRFQTRMLAVGTIAVIALSAIAINTVWRVIVARIHALPFRLGKSLGVVVSLLFLGLLAGSVLDAFTTNQKLPLTFPPNNPDASALKWLRSYDGGLYRVSAPNNWYLTAVETGIRQIDLWYPVANVRSYAGQINTRPVEAQAHYLIRPADVQVPEAVEKVGENGNLVIYKNQNALPYAFWVSSKTLSAEISGTTAPLSPVEVIPVAPDLFNNNEYWVTVDHSETDSILIITTSSYPGWKVRIDGQPALLQKVGGFLAVALLPGKHTYHFVYSPDTFYTGAVISLLALVVTLWLIGREWQPAIRLNWLGQAKRVWQGRLINFGSAMRQKTDKKEPSQSQRDDAPAGDITPPEVTAFTVTVPDNTHRDRSEPATARIEIRAEIPAGTTLHFSITAEADGQVTVTKKPLPPQTNIVAVKTARPGFSLSGLKLPRLKRTWTEKANIEPLTRLLQKPEWVFGGLAVLVSLILIAWKLEFFPVYFFGDEAYQVLFAETLIKNNFLAANPQGIPIYIEAAGNRWTPMISTYLHAITLLLFGKSIIVARLTTGLVGMAGLVAVGFALREIFKSRLWWLAPLAALSMPAWLLHARTGFETVMSTGFYGGFTLFYLLYRYKSPEYIYGALAFGAAVFYSYSNAQAIMAAAGLMLLLADMRYHWQNRASVAKGLVFAALLAIPLLIFRIKEPGAIAEHMRTVNSFIVQDIPLSEKIIRYAQNYFYGLSPQYWFIPNTHDLIRHRMQGMGQIATWLLPFFATGLVVSLSKIRESAYRTIILLALAVPAGAATLEITITRVLPFIIPATLLIVLGMDWLRERLLSNRPQAAIFASLLLLFSATGALTLRTALTQGPLWTNDYGLYGLQFGAKQIFADTLPRYLKQDPAARVFVSSTWANGTDNFLRFFIPPPDQPRITMTGIDSFVKNKLELTPNDLFVLTAQEYPKVVESGRFKEIKVEEIIPYPNGQPGFYIVRLVYVDNIENILAAEKEELRKPVIGEVEIDGQMVKITYARIDIGQPADLFDGNLFSLMRGAEANPYTFELTFPQPRTVSGLILDLATMDYEVIVSLFTPGNPTPAVYQATGEQITTDAHIEMTFENAPASVERMSISIRNLRTGDYANVHIREVKLLP